MHSHPRSSSSTNRVGDDETLTVFRVVNKLSDSVIHDVHAFLPDGVVTTCEVVGSVFFAVDVSLGVKQPVPFAVSDIVDDRVFQVDEKVSWNALCTSFFKEGLVVCIFIPFRNGFRSSCSNFLGDSSFTLFVDAMLSTVLFPDGSSEVVIAHPGDDAEIISKNEVRSGL